MNTKVSVVIPSYNTAKYVATAVRSALAQTYANVEVVVVDDGSTDDTRAALDGCFQDIRYVRQENAGLPSARNTGIRHSTGEIIAFLDADDWWSPEKLSLQVAKLTRSEKPVLVHTDVFLVDGLSEAVSRVDCQRRRYQGNCYGSLFFEHRILPSSVAVWRDAIVTAGLFDSSLRNGCEDYDMWIRLARLGAFAYLDEPLVYYRQLVNSMSTKAMKMSAARVEVVEKSLRSDKVWTESLDPKMVTDRLQSLYFDAAYQHWLGGDYASARRFAGKSIGHRFNSVMAKVYLLSSMPGPVRDSAIWLRKKLQAVDATNLAGGPIA